MRFTSFAEREYDPMPAFTLKAVMQELQLVVPQAEYALKATIYGADRSGPIPKIENVRELACAADICAIYHYAINGFWVSDLDLTLCWDTVESLLRMTELAEVALIGCDEYKNCPLLSRLNLLAIARAKLDYPLSGFTGRLMIYPAESDPLGYGDLALLSGLSLLTVRNLASGSKRVLNPTKVGREVHFDPREAQDWLIRAKDYRPTEIVEKEQFWGDIDRMLADSKRAFN